MKRIILTISAALLGTTMWAQQNVLLDRAFWGKKPSVKEVKAAIEAGNSPIAMNSNSFNATAVAIMADAPMETIAYLVSLEDNDINTITHDGRTYIFWAAYKNNVPAVTYLVEHGATVNLKDGHGIPLLNFMTYGKVSNLKLYDYLITKGADVTLTTKDGATVLLLAMQFVQDNELVSFLTSKGLSLNDTDDNGNNALFYAARAGNVAMLKALVKKEIPYDKTNKQAENVILYAAHGTRGGHANLETFQYFKDLGVHVATSNKAGETPLLLSAGNNPDPKVIQFFIENGVDVNAVNTEGDNALILAAQRNNLEVVTLLTDQTQAINHSNKEGKTALMYAVQGNDIKTVAYLLDHGASPKVVDSDGNTLLYYWANERKGRGMSQAPNAEKLALLKSYGFDYTQAMPNGNTLWHLAVDKGSEEFLAMALKSGAAINAKNEEGYTPLLLAAMNAKDTKVMEYLVKHGADIKITTDFDESAYDLAAENEVLKQQKASLTFLK